MRACSQRYRSPHLVRKRFNALLQYHKRDTTSGKSNTLAYNVSRTLVWILLLCMIIEYSLYPYGEASWRGQGVSNDQLCFPVHLQQLRHKTTKVHVIGTLPASVKRLEYVIRPIKTAGIIQRNHIGRTSC